MRLQLSSKYGEYDALMRFLTETGMDFLEMIDLREIPFSNLLESVYKKANTSYFKDVLQQLRDNYSTGSTRFGRYTIRYLLLNLREDLLERVMPSQFSPQWKCKDLYLSRKCFPFECNPLASDLADSKTSQISQAKYLARIVEKEKTEVAVPYWSIVKSMQDTGEIYCDLGGDLTEQAIQKYNDCLDDWEKRQGYEIISDGNAACIAAYEASTLFILNKLLELSQLPNKAQGLEYRSVKVVIPSSNAEKITHGIFYTAITRAKEKLKIYWSSETMQEVVAGFSIDTSRQKSLAIIKEKLKQDKNT